MNADSNDLSIAMTSPVDFISGPSMVSTLGNLLKGNTGSLIEMLLFLAILNFESFNALPIATFSAILTIGFPVALATKGTVLLLRGFTSNKKMLLF